MTQTRPTIVDNILENLFYKDEIFQFQNWYFILLAESNGRNINYDGQGRIARLQWWNKTESEWCEWTKQFIVLLVVRSNL